MAEIPLNVALNLALEMKGAMIYIKFNHDIYALFKLSALTPLIITIRVAGITRRTHVLVPVNALMVLGKLRGVIVFVTSNTTEKGKIVRGSMALYTLIPLILVLTTVYRKILLVMMESRR